MGFVDTPRIFRIGSICVAISLCFYGLMWDNTEQVWGPRMQFIRNEGDSITPSVLKSAQALHTVAFICLLLCLCLILTYVYVERENFIAKIVLLVSSFIATIGVLSGTILWGTHRPPKSATFGATVSSFVDYNIGEQVTLTFGSITFLLSAFGTFCFFLHLTQIQIPSLTQEAPDMPKAEAAGVENPVQVVP